MTVLLKKITVVGGESKSMKSYVYKLVLHSTQGQRTEIEAYGIQTISSKIEAVALDKLADRLQIQRGKLNRPQEGKVNVLIGQQYPVRVKSSGNLILMENDFGLVVAGTCAVTTVDSQMSTDFRSIREADVMHIVTVKHFNGFL